MQQISLKHCRLVSLVTVSSVVCTECSNVFFAEKHVVKIKVKVGDKEYLEVSEHEHLFFAQRGALEKVLAHIVPPGREALLRTQCPASLEVLLLAFDNAVASTRL